ncbi:MAG: short-chain fatty acid transporter, partial [Gammaproteobacteria bacterium]
PLIAASAYVGFLSWHGGLSGSAPLVVAQASHPQADLVGTIPIARTILAAPNLLLLAGFLVALPLIMASMARRAPAEVPPPAPGDLAPEAPADERRTPAGRLGHSLAVALTALVPAALVLALVLAPGFAAGTRGFDLNVILFVFLFGALALHRSPLALSRSVGRGAGEAGGILLQFPFYFAILGAMRASGLVAILAQAGVDAALALARLGLPAGWAFETLTFLNAGLVNLFVPSGGGQWAVQGEIVLRAALDPAIGVDPARAVMALAYGDAWTNMLQPFWALALLSITRTRAREIMGYTLAAMLLVFPLYLLVFAVA